MGSAQGAFGHILRVHRGLPSVLLGVCRGLRLEERGPNKGCMGPKETRSVKKQTPIGAVLADLMTYVEGVFGFNKKGRRRGRIGWGRGGEREEKDRLHG